ncbi:hypothetical protein [uncultured Dysosmobacter sp.]|uniref:hypothetical protein n=1 Tax=uncultured Dysosmobacter sp. TaxID=2591384 RepID=UPI00262D3234|nr:hypothetical protein [uncultured Dysosmobacter sp.]
MTGRIYTSEHQVFDLPEPVEWQVIHTGTVPCDSYAMTVLYQPDMRPVLERAAGFAAIWEGETVLRGTVDEYTVELGTEGLTATISGRGYAARLLDNETRPVTYQDATLAEIIRCHVTPYGIACQEVADVRAGNVFTAAAGISQWKVLDGFCRTYGGFSPRFSRTGKLIAAPERASGTYLTIGDEDPVLACTLREDHYGVLTEALVIDKTRNVSYSVKNRDMIAKGGQCRRVIYTPGQSTWAAMRYTGEYQIQRSREDEKIVTLTLPGSFPAFPGDRVSLELRRMGLRGMFRVAEEESVFSQRGGATATLTLKESV